ncbi:non-heme iron oxygenase ferredoxin subunit [Candidatus Woesearchaeota archaeon]|nr:non-heme iron oxygenase ferredoxin subunit [Candidatus Woesearchaeota archaeon]
MPFVKAATRAEIQPGTGKVVVAAGKRIALFNVEGEFYAIDNTCPHKGSPLGEGELDGKTVSCPGHGWLFDVTTGKGRIMPVGVSTHNVKIEGDDVLVEV